MASIALGNNLREREKKIREIIQEEADRTEVVTTEDVRRRWAAHLEKVYPKCPWLATVLPSNKVVDVVKVDWCNFKATVEIVDDQNETDKSEDCLLLELTPISVDEDEESISRIKESVKAIDHFRFFINYLWFPWDEDDDGEDAHNSDENWIAEHLSLRFMAIESEVFSKLKKLARDYQEIKDNLRNDDDNIVVNLNSQERLDRISKVAAMMENPEIAMEFAIQKRKAKENLRLFDIDRGYSIDRQAVLVWQNGGKIEEYQEILIAMKNVIPFNEPHVVVKDKLQDAIDSSVPNDVIILAPGEYHLEDLGDLTSCLSVFGLGSDPSKVKINLNCGYGYEVVLTNGYGYFSNVTVTSKHGQGGFWIKNGASLEVKDCRMVGFQNAFKISGEESSVKLKWCEIQACHYGIQVEKGAKFQMTGGLIEDCNFGISAETEGEEPSENIKLEEVDNYASVKFDILPHQSRV